jgi:hypothetical protein
MSTDLKSPKPAPAEPEDRQPAAPKLDLSLTQILGGALAAMTAAFLGSRLSLAGTVVGAALASVVAAVAGNLYTVSLQTTREKVRTVWQGKVGEPELAAAAEQLSRPLPQAQPTGPARRVRWSSVLLGALATFALAAAVLTGLELASGQALSGGDGTTITEVAKNSAPAPVDADPSPAAESGSPSASPSSSAAPTPSESATVEPTPAASAPGSAAPTPTPSASGSPSAEPSPTAQPSTPAATPQG